MNMEAVRNFDLISDVMVKILSDGHCGGKYYLLIKRYRIVQAVK
jgi:hypothetical protein